MLRENHGRTERWMGTRETRAPLEYEVKKLEQYKRWSKIKGLLLDKFFACSVTVINDWKHEKVCTDLETALIITPIL